ncbi:hypothetical protein NL676_016443 [Syzygium grande]|nr:hypothetical protein NL676_016443 [Syzygium grande]
MFSPPPPPPLLKNASLARAPPIAPSRFPAIFSRSGRSLPNLVPPASAGPRRSPSPPSHRSVISPPAYGL